MATLTIPRVPSLADYLGDLWDGLTIDEPSAAEILTAPKATVREIPQQPTVKGDIPAGILRRYPKITLPEWQFWWAAEKEGWKHGIDFQYQVPLQAGAVEPGSLGSTIADFFCPESGRAGRPALAVYVNGIYWHYERDASKIVRELILYGIIKEQYAIDVVVVDEDDLATNARYYTMQALRYRRDIGSRVKGRY